MSTQTVHVVGGGLVGSLTAIYLARAGFPVELHERRPDLRSAHAPAGRSINLVVTARGLRALEEVGLKERVLKIALPMKGRMLHDEEGGTSFVPYGQKEGEVINAVSRGLLNRLLLEAAGEYKNLDIHFERRCAGYDLKTSVLHFVDEKTGQDEHIAASVVIGADGAFSAVRRSMLENVMNFDYSQAFLEHGYKELVIPPADGGGFRIDPGALHIWPRKSFMMIALPNTDGSFTCTLFLPLEGGQSFARLQTPGDLQDFFLHVFPDALELMPTLAEDFFANPVGSMVTLRCHPWHAGGRATLIGDAAHAIVPFFGQGMNCGFEDCAALGALIGRNKNPDWETVFAALESARKPNAEAVADMALENFIEMRDSTASPEFQLRKQVGFELERRFPRRFIPRYSMVVFHPEISYAEAQRRGRIQDRILDALCAGLAAPERTDWRKAERLMAESGL